MKITKSQLQNLIKESVKEVMNEQQKGIDVVNHKNLTIIGDTPFEKFPRWFKPAHTENAVVELDYGKLIWHSGMWKNGLWLNGTWLNGTWKKGTFNNGTWHNGTWHNGIWDGGEWKNGVWLDGNWNTLGKWRDGVFLKGKTYSRFDRRARDSKNIIGFGEKHPFSGREPILELE
jgi:hypothetical protein